MKLTHTHRLARYPNDGRDLSCWIVDAIVNDHFGGIRDKTDDDLLMFQLNIENHRRNTNFCIVTIAATRIELITRQKWIEWISVFV